MRAIRRVADNPRQDAQTMDTVWKHGRHCWERRECETPRVQMSPLLGPRFTQSDPKENVRQWRRNTHEHSEKAGGRSQIRPDQEKRLSAGAISDEIVESRKAWKSSTTNVAKDEMRFETIVHPRSGSGPNDNNTQTRTNLPFSSHLPSLITLRVRLNCRLY